MSEPDRIAAPSRPLPSATVALARDGDDGPELLLVLRHGKTSFGDSYVFPGGLLEAQDCDVFDLCDGVTPAEADARLGVEDQGLSWYSAAIRELFEEAGVLLARDAQSAWADAAQLAGFRDQLNEGLLRWRDFLTAHDLRLACAELHYFSFWITPRELGKRFSTRFFAARLPAGQGAAHCGRELVDSRWLTAREALQLAECNDVSLPYPTRVTLDALRRFRDVDEFVAWAERACADGVSCRRPALVGGEGERRIVMPGDRQYPDYGRDNER